ncbi:MAG: translation initiation factor IF-2 [Lachnospiraceae bacterium]|nr:translation initiation factor IF-2 [Lachnospiraceae bacterium]
MAKTKISELEAACGADRKDIIAFLNEKGIDAKTAGSSVDEAAAALVMDRFGAGNAKTSAPAQDSDKTPSGGTVKKVVKKVIRKKIIVVNNSGASAKRPAGQSSASAARSSQTGSRKPQAGGHRNEARPAGTYHPIKPRTAPSDLTAAVRPAGVTDAAQVRKAESPVQEAKEQPVSRQQENTVSVSQQTASAAEPEKTQVVSAASKVTAAQAPAAPEKTVNAGVQAAAQPEKAPASDKMQAETAKTAPASAEPEKKEPPKRRNIFDEMQAARKREAAARAAQRGDGQRGGRSFGGNGQQGGRSYGGNGQQGGRSFGGGGQRGGRSYGGNGQQGGRSFGGNGQQGGRSFGGNGQQGGRSFGGSSAAPAFGADNKRRQNQAKDKRNRKDFAYTEEEQKERKGRSGRFVRPVAEKKEEPVQEQIKVITIPEKLTIGELADAMHMKAAELIKKLFLAGKAMTVNSEVSYEEAENIAADYDILCEKEEKVDVIEELLKEEDDKEEDMVSRPPVICVMGHVDHGKTSILDYIRKSHVTAKEAGGITQAIGAYTVKTKDGRDITFLDTPGHEAFTAMRLRGAQSTDIAVLVVAADDGVMPQTIEAINHAKAAGVEIIVAVNKIDKPDADPDRVKTQLTQYGLTASDWGGQTEFVNVSAKTGQGIDDLLDTILLQADVMELKANPNRLARGLVLEARLDRGRGPVANVLVQKGTLHVGDFVSAGPAFGKVRAMINDKGDNVKEAGPSIPVMVMGLSDVPSAGEVIVAHSSNDEAKSYAETYKAQHKEELVEENRMSMKVEDLFDQMREGKMKELELIVKADVQGSVEALCTSLQKLSNDEVMVKIIHSAVGNISESDVTLAEASNAAIIGFNVHPDATAKSIADHGGVSIHLYKVIYQAIDDVDAALKGMLAPVYEEKVIGHAQVRQLFRSGKIGNIAGCMVLDGVIEKGCSVRITRDGEQIFDGELESLKRFKDDVKEVKAGYDCGLVFKDWDSMNVDDTIEAYKMVEVPREEVERRKAAEANKTAKTAKQ